MTERERQRHAERKREKEKHKKRDNQDRETGIQRTVRHTETDTKGETERKNRRTGTGRVHCFMIHNPASSVSASRSYVSH